MLHNSANHLHLLYIFKLEDGEQEFVTSDNPVILQNLINQQIFPYAPSNIMKLPLDTKHYLMLMPNNNKSNLNRIVRHKIKVETEDGEESEFIIELPYEK